MSKLFTKLMILALLLALVGPFFIKGPNGRPLMSLDDINFPRLSMPELPALTPEGAPEVTAAWSDGRLPEGSFIPQAGTTYPRGSGIYYRYQDAQGVWQFSDSPKQGVENFVAKTNSKANIIQSLDKSTVDRALGREAPAESAVSTAAPSGMPGLTTVPVTEIPNLIQQAKDVQALTQQRAQALERMNGQ